MAVSLGLRHFETMKWITRCCRRRNVNVVVFYIKCFLYMLIRSTCFCIFFSSLCKKLFDVLLQFRFLFSFFFFFSLYCFAKTFTLKQLQFFHLLVLFFFLTSIYTYGSFVSNIKENYKLFLMLASFNQSLVFSEFIFFFLSLLHAIAIAILSFISIFTFSLSLSLSLCRL